MQMLFTAFLDLFGWWAFVVGVEFGRLERRILWGTASDSIRSSAASIKRCFWGSGCPCPCSFPGQYIIRHFGSFTTASLQLNIVMEYADRQSLYHRIHVC